MPRRHRLTQSEEEALVRGTVAICEYAPSLDIEDLTLQIVEAVGGFEGMADNYRTMVADALECGNHKFLRIIMKDVLGLLEFVNEQNKKSDVFEKVLKTLSQDELVKTLGQYGNQAKQLREALEMFADAKSLIGSEVAGE